MAQCNSVSICHRSMYPRPGIRRYVVCRNGRYCPFTIRGVSIRWKAPGSPAPGRPLGGRASYPRTSFLYLIRCGWSASGPFRFRRSSMYD